jgi:hypothetical protein
MAPRPNLKNLKTLSLASIGVPTRFFGSRPPQAGDVAVLDDAGTALLMWVEPKGKGWVAAYNLLRMNAHGKELYVLTA